MVVIVLQFSVFETKHDKVLNFFVNKVLYSIFLHTLMLKKNVRKESKFRIYFGIIPL